MYGEQKTTNSSGIGFVGLLQIAFIVLKLNGTIDWTWLWVLSPIWIYAVLIVLVIIVYLVILFKEKF